MLSLIKKITIAASLLALYSGQFDAHGSPHGIVSPDAGHEVVPTSALQDSKDPQLPLDLRKQVIRLVASKIYEDNKNANEIALVSKEWKGIIDAEKKIIGSPCWKAFNGIKPQDEALLETFRNMTLLYRPDPASDEGMIPLSIPRGSNPFEHTFDLSTCGDRAQYVRITTSVEEFFKVSGENEDKVVILIHPFGSIAKRHKAKFKDVKAWSPEAPVDIFWRWGNDQNLTWYDYLSSCSLAAISAESLYENWKKSVRSDDELSELGAVVLDGFASRKPRPFMLHF